MNTSEIEIGEQVVVGQARVNGAMVPDEFTGWSGAVLEVDGNDVLVQPDTDDRAGFWIRDGRLVPAASQPLPVKTSPTPAQLAGGADMDAGTKYFVTPAPGYYGDRTQVLSSHHTLGAARKARVRGSTIRRGHLAKGDPWLRVYEETYPEVQ